MGDKEGFRIWEIQKNEVPKEIHHDKMIEGNYGDFIEYIDKLELENKTYAIRIGKEGLK